MLFLVFRIFSTAQTMLARIQGIIGPFPAWMVEDGEEAVKYFTPEGCVYKRMDDDSCELCKTSAGKESDHFQHVVLRHLFKPVGTRSVMKILSRPSFVQSFLLYCSSPPQVPSTSRSAG